MWVLVLRMKKYLTNSEQTQLQRTKYEYYLFILCVFNFIWFNLNVVMCTLACLKIVNIV